MKKIALGAACAILTLATLAGCSKKDDKAIIVGATPLPHAEILKAAKPLLEEKGYTLEIKEFSDYVQPNVSLQNGDLTANFFQHAPYMEDFNAKNKGELVALAAVHYEPMGIYAGRCASLSELADGATIAIPNDTTNEARALQLLEAEGLITLRDGVGLEATPKDIASNPKNLKLTELDAAQISRALPDVDLGVINGNYALEADLSPTSALAAEKSSAEAAQTYANIIAVKKSELESDKVKALLEVMQSEEIRTFIEQTYTDGSTVPIF